MKNFEIIHEDNKARIGILKTQYGQIETPIFLAVATRGVGKHYTSMDLIAIDHNSIISNALILNFRPGSQLIEEMGGLHKFMNFNGCIFTDCGGFQASRHFFQGKDNTGLNFLNPYNNQKFKITPKSIMNIQLEIGSDVAMMLDDMAPYGASYDQAKEAMELTHKWGKLSLDFHNKLKIEKNSNQMLFGIVQGNFYEDLRKESAKYISSLSFDGIAIGGVAIGEPKEEMYMAVNSAIVHLPREKPKYIMGLGTPLDILNMIEKGVDVFDSVYPTKVARHNTLFTKDGLIYLNRGKHKNDNNPIEKDCDCIACLNYSRAYINHLSKIEETSALRLKSLHNIRFIKRMIEDAKIAIKEKRFKEFKEEFTKRFEKK